jgi:hypothetical protein
MKVSSARSAVNSNSYWYSKLRKRTRQCYWLVETTTADQSLELQSSFGGAVDKDSRQDLTGYRGVAGTTRCLFSGRWRGRVLTGRDKQNKNNRCPGVILPSTKSPPPNPLHRLRSLIHRLSSTTSYRRIRYSTVHAWSRYTVSLKGTTVIATLYDTLLIRFPTFSTVSFRLLLIVARSSATTPSNRPLWTPLTSTSTMR